MRTIDFGNSPALRVIGARAFRNCISLPNIAMPNTVETIGANAFQGAREFTRIVVPNSVTTIGANAFINCVNVTEVVIGDRVRTIGDSAFRNNTSLEHLTISPSVVEIGDSAFRNTGLRTVEFSHSVQQIENNAFRDNPQLMSAVIPPNVWKFGTGINAGTGTGGNIFTNTHPMFTVFGEIGSPAEEFAINNSHFFAPIGDVVTLIVDGSTNIPTINLWGNAPIGREVRIFDGNTQIGTFVTGPAGRFGGDVTMVGEFGMRIIEMISLSSIQSPADNIDAICNILPSTKTSDDCITVNRGSLCVLI